MCSKWVFGQKYSDSSHRISFQSYISSVKSSLKRVFRVFYVIKHDTQPGKELMSYTFELYPWYRTLQKSWQLHRWSRNSLHVRHSRICHSIYTIPPVDLTKSHLTQSITLKPLLSKIHVNTLRTGDADLRFYITTVQDGWRKSAFLTRVCFPCTIHLIMQYKEPVSEWPCWRMFIETWPHSELTFRHCASSI